MSNRVTITPFVAWHAEAIRSRNPSELGDFAARAQLVAQAGPGISLLEDGKVICCIGMVFLMPGNAEVWVVASPEIARHGPTLHRTARWAIAEARRRFDLVRLSCSIEAGNERARRWAVRLGFSYEGPLRAYGPGGRDHDRYALIFPQNPGAA